MLVLYFPCWIYWFEKFDEKEQNTEKQTEKSEKPEKPEKHNNKQFGVWEELYGAVDGAKCWYNTETRETTTKDPFR